MLEKVGVDGFSGSRREIDIKHEFDFELLRKTLGSTCSIAVFSVISKQQAKFSLFLWDWYSEKWGLADLPGHDMKLTSDINFIWR